MSRIPVGLQLYTLRNETAGDFIGTLKSVAEMGYKAVEFAGYGDIPAKEMRKVLDDLGLVASSAHIGLPLEDQVQLESQLAFHIEYNLEIGSEFVITPYSMLNASRSAEEVSELHNTFKYIAAEVKKSGLKYLYHNHDFELATGANGKVLLDELYETIDPSLLQAELDLYWVKKAGLDPKSYLLNYKGRCPIIHVKDMTGDDRQYFAEVGQGVIDFPSIFNVAEEVGIQYYIVEQDQCERSPLESIKMSIDYLKSIGIA